MADNWKWTSSGLYDGDVPIIWVTQTIQGELMVGVMADWEDAIAAAPAMLEALRKIHNIAQRAEEPDWEWSMELISRAALAAAEGDDGHTR